MRNAAPLRMLLREFASGFILVLYAFPEQRLPADV
jgi:hypothetical protein